MQFSFIFILSMMCIILCTSINLEPTYGVSPSDNAMYTKDTFTCKDGSAVLPKSRINDDFCDCKDGSDEPGTSACSNGHFYCKNEGHIGKSIDSSRVNDGICDCCDGSDEYNGFITCQNTCAEDNKKWISDNEERLSTFNRGSTILKTWIEESQSIATSNSEKEAEFNNEINRINEEIRLANEELKLLHEDDASHPTEPESEIFDQTRFVNYYSKLGIDKLEGNELRFLVLHCLSRNRGFGQDVINQYKEDLKSIRDDVEIDESVTLNDIKSLVENKENTEETEEELNKKEEIKELEKELEKVKTDLTSLDLNEFYGANNEFYMMKGQCYSKQLNKYTYKVCPFATSYQDSTSLGSHFDIVNKNDEVISKTTNVHVNLQNEMTDGDIYFYWKDGTQCWNGPKRSLKLRLVCHDSVELLSLSEPSMCLYVGELGTPAVCPL